MTHYAAIPTVYKGVQFRSRLEARWAAAFDLLGVSWRYEPFDLNGWIPDFLVDTLPIDPYHAVGTGYGEKLRKPFLVEIKPINTVDHSPSVGEHRIVTNKIEDALGAPRGRNGQGPTWLNFFDDLEFVPTLLGATPAAGWTFQRHVGWYWIAGRQVQDDLSAGPEFSWMPNHNSVWIKAGNEVQWSRPISEKLNLGPKLFGRK